jgi:glycosyltransferase involved in cell wall biosynthesis
VLNEEEQLADSVSRLHDAMIRHCGGCFSLVIADNGSTDDTPKIAARLVLEYPQVELLRLDQRGRGGALRTAWLHSTADVLAYMDVDLSTDIAHLPELLGAVLSGKCDVAIGSRLLPESQIRRSFKREVLSRGYSGLLRTVLGLQVRDAQCGFKALSRDAARRLLPLVQNNHWFFDTELLAHAQWQGLRISELPVRWVHDPGSRVRLLPTIAEDLLGIGRLWLRRRRAAGKENMVGPEAVSKELSR